MGLGQDGGAAAVPDSAEGPLLRVEFVRPEGVRMVTEDGFPFDIARDTLQGDAAAGDIIRLVPDGNGGVTALSHPAGASPSSKEAVLALLRTL